MISMRTSSVVGYVPQSSEPHHCGYCGKNGSRHAAGIWGHRLRVSDYQILMDRGWRRCGKFIYKPDLQKSCCPLYTIRIEALECVISKSHRKVIKKVMNYLQGNTTLEELKRKHEEGNDTQQIDTKSHNDNVKKSIDGEKGKNQRDASVLHQNNVEAKATSRGPDPTKPKRRKAKDIRREKKLEKLSRESDMTTEQIKKHIEEAKEKEVKENIQKRVQILDELFKQMAPTLTPGHKLEVKLVLADRSLPQFQLTFKKSHEIYQKYQMAIHNDRPDECDEGQFKRFLVDTALMFERSPEFPSTGCGTFHQQYYLDGELIAVGVLDILPQSLSSVYFFYDPDYAFFSLGVFSCLRELSFARQINRDTPSMQYYYMGLYNYDCKKLTYKGQYDHSYLLCPETYVWTPLPECIPKFKVTKYSRLYHGSENNNPETDYNKVHIMFMNRIMTFPVYCKLSESYETEVAENYAKHVGLTLCRRMLLHRS